MWLQHKKQLKGEINIKTIIEGSGSRGWRGWSDCIVVSTLTLSLPPFKQKPKRQGNFFFFFKSALKVSFFIVWMIFHFKNRDQVREAILNHTWKLFLGFLFAWPRDFIKFSAILNANFSQPCVHYSFTLKKLHPKIYIFLLYF